MKAEQARRFARLAFAYHVTPAQLRGCTLRELDAMERHVSQIERRTRRKGGS